VFFATAYFEPSPEPFHFHFRYASIFRCRYAAITFQIDAVSLSVLPGSTRPTITMPVCFADMQYIDNQPSDHR